jgi:hypothetical protein
MKPILDIEMTLDDIKIERYALVVKATLTVPWPNKFFSSLPWQKKTKECPRCKRLIPADVLFCPTCYEDVGGFQDDETPF